MLAAMTTAVPQIDDWQALARAAEALCLVLRNEARPRRLLAAILELKHTAWMLLLTLALSLVEGFKLRPSAAGQRAGPLPPAPEPRPLQLWRNPPAFISEPVEVKAQPDKLKPAVEGEPRAAPHPGSHLLAVLALCADPLGHARRLAASLRRAARAGTQAPVPNAAPAKASPRHTHSSFAIKLLSAKRARALLSLDSS